jgi:hypothetical protein
MDVTGMALGEPGYASTYRKALPDDRTSPP